MTSVWLDSRGNLLKVYEALLESPEAWSQPLAKFKTPADYIYSSYRALGLPLREKRRTLQAFEALGQRNLQPGSPAGWPDTSAGLGWFVGIAQAHRLGRRGGAAHGRRTQCTRAGAATAGRDTERRHHQGHRARRKRRAGADPAHGFAGIHAALR